LARESKESGERVLRLLEKVVKPSFNLVMDGAPKNEVLLHLILMKMVELIDPIPLHDVMIGFDSKMMRNNPKLPKEYPKSMHLVSKCVGGGEQ
jgi:hypothetical protein